MLGTQKPPRLRSACTECYAAKVRCSGEKHGCERCRRNGVPCEYQVSMVGRTPKRRRTKASDQISRPQESRVLPSATLHQSGPENRYSPQPVDSSFMPEKLPPSAGNIMGVGPVSGMGDFNVSETEINSYLQNLLSDYPDLPLVSPGMTDPFLLETENLLASSRPVVHGTFSSEGKSKTSDPRQASPASSHVSSMFNKQRLESAVQELTAKSVRSRLAEHTEARLPRSYRDRSLMAQYPHAAALMKVIECLEAQLQVSQVSIDQAMRLNRQAMAKVREVSNTDEFRSCQSCPLLVATIMDLVVGLYELVIFSIQRPAGKYDPTFLPNQNNVSWAGSPIQQPNGTGEQPSDGSSPGSAISGGSEPPLFQFGCLEFDPDEQVIFRDAMVRRDLRRCVETIKYCSEEIFQRQRQAADLGNSPLSHGGFSSTRPFNHIHTQWYQEMGYRIKELLVALPALCGHP